MKKSPLIAFVAACAVAIAATEATASTAGTFGGWRISSGGKFGFGLKTRLNSTVPQSFYSSATSPALGSGAAIGAALMSGTRVDFINGAFIDPTSSYAVPNTQNWQIPVSDLDTTLKTLTFYSQQISGSSVNAAGRDDDAVSYGASIELERTLFAHESGFGLDFGVSLDWMRANNCFKISGSGLYLSRTRYTYTPSSPTVNSALFSGLLPVYGGYYGIGSPTLAGTPLNYGDFNGSTITTSSTTSGYSMDASGDYEEWEILLLLKPWYEIKPWWRVNATIGLGVTRSEFEYTVMANFGQDGVYRSRNTTAEWRCCPVAGVGTLVKVWEIDLSCDFLVRISPDSMSIRGEGISGTIEKPDCILRLAAGIDF